MAGSMVLFGQQDSVAEGYGMAGCGLGAIVMGPEPGFNQVFAATTNGTSANQTFAITSGTSECTPGSKVSMEIRQRHFMTVNQEKIQAEIAQGNGENLDAYTNLLGCSADSKDKVHSVLQQNFEQIFSGKDLPKWVHHKMKKAIASDAQTKKACTDVWL